MLTRRLAHCWYLLAMGALAACSQVDARPPGGGHGFHVPMPDQELFVECTLSRDGKAERVEEVLRLHSMMAPTDLDQSVGLPAPLAPLVLKRYLPQAIRRQNVVPVDGPGGMPAIHLSISGSTQLSKRWLVSGDAERNSLTSLIGTWRYMVVSSRSERDELYRKFREELSRPPMLIISGSDGGEAVEMPAKAGLSKTFEKLQCKIKVQEFFPHFGMQKESKQPSNQSDKRMNPAALVEIERGTKKEQRWVFAKFPAFEGHGAEALPYRITLDCPLERRNPAPDFAVVTVGLDRHETWTRHQGKTVSKSVAIDEETTIPGSAYTFSLASFVPDGRLVELFETTTEKSASTVLQVEFSSSAVENGPIWLELGKPRIIPTEVGSLNITFASRQAGPPGGAK